MGKEECRSDLFIFYPYGLAHKTGRADFYLPKNTDVVVSSVHMQDSVDEGWKITVDMKSINDIITELKHERIDILKINIESSEYDVIE